jgi:hypothetical protein
MEEGARRAVIRRRAILLRTPSVSEIAEAPPATLDTGRPVQVVVTARRSFVILRRSISRARGVGMGTAACLTRCIRDRVGRSQKF